MVYKNKLNALRKASVKHLGCRLNQYEALAMEGKLMQAGYQIVPFGEPADIGIINTCTVTNEADAKSRNTIRRFIRSNPSAVVVVVGCYSQVSANEVATIKGVDYIIGNHDKLNFLDYLEAVKTESPVIVRERISSEDFSIGFVGESSFDQRANLKIQDGCDFSCSFCIIPQARGRARSRSWPDLLEEAKGMLQKGVREIVLTGVNLGTYLSEGNDFLNLIEGLSALKGLDRLRVSSIEPTTIPRELFGWMADPSHPLMPYLHIPMQAGSDKILKLMRRRYRLEDMKGFFQEAMNQIPDLCLGTDLMVGFPNETSDDFEQTCSTFMEFPFSYCHVFTYSERQGTAANRMDQIPMQERRTRSAHLRRLSASKRMSFHEGQMGREFRVLLENPKDDLQSGYTDHYLKVILKEKGPEMANKMAKVKITEALPEYVIGDLIEVES